jgi:hypothetical protein
MPAPRLLLSAPSIGGRRSLPGFVWHHRKCSGDPGPNRAESDTNGLLVPFVAHFYRKVLLFEILGIWEQISKNDFKRPGEECIDPTENALRNGLALQEE